MIRATPPTAIIAAMALTLLARPAVAVFDAAPLPNSEDRAFEQLPDLSLVRGANLPLKHIAITADAGESWTVTVTYAAGSDVGEWILATPASGSGDATIVVRLDAALLTGDGPYQGTVTLTPDVGAAVDLPVNVAIWPSVNQDPSREELADPVSWPADGSYYKAWELWGFLPNQISHPPDADNPDPGGNIDLWEKTPCPEGGPYDESCTRPGQAGLAAGQSADAAWRLSTGDPRVKVAVLDSGIRWRERELHTKYALNIEELRACPPPGATPSDDASFDVDQDGVLTMRDYDGSAYVDLNQNGLLDPQDLIHGEHPDTGDACSDGVDDDGNGYVDDICGWDFFWNDNDPSDDTDYGHGTGEAQDSVAEGNNGEGGIGVCPRCLFIPVRVGDSFIADANEFAEGVIFSVDSGAKVVQEALGSLNSTTFMQQAIDYAYQRGVTVVASAADETSYHHNYPGAAEHTLYVHSIVYDNDGDDVRDAWKQASTFLNFCNCTNYGGHLVLSTPGSSCSSEATGKTAGHAGLVHSYFLQERERTGDAYFNAELTTEESYQILHQGADDMDVPTDDHMPEQEGRSCQRNEDCAPPWYHCYRQLDTSDPTHQTISGVCASTKYPTNPGWDEHFGYGRNNARRSLEMIRDKLIPPAVDITRPRWFEVVNPTLTPQLDIYGSVDSPRYDTIEWTLEWAAGIAPSEDEWQQLSSGQVTRGAPLFEEKLGTLDTTAIFADVSAVPQERDDRTVTVRLVATAAGGAGTARGVFRKTFAVHHDPDLAPGWPIFIGAGVGSGKITDLDGDGTNDLVFASNDGDIHALHADGAALPGFPVAVNPYPSLSSAVCSADPSKCHRQSAAYSSGIVDDDHRSCVMGPVAIGDLDGDGVGKSVVVATQDGLIYAFGADGQMRDGFPVELDWDHVSEFEWGKYQVSEQRFAELGVFAAPALEDLDGDGDLEIVIAGMTQWVYAWHHDGSEVNGWPVHCFNDVYDAGTQDGERLDGRIIASPAMADLDGDGLREVVVGTNERVESTTYSFVYAIWGDANAHAGGPFLPRWPQRVSGFVPDEILPYVGRGQPTSPAAADVDGDGEDEVIIAGMGGNITKLGKDGFDGEVPLMSSSSEYYGPNSNTKEIVTLPLINDPSIADMDLDGRLDVIDGTAGIGLVRLAAEGGRRADYDHSVSVWDLESGYMHDGFPQKVKDFQFFMNYIVADIDGDGKPESISGDGGYFVHAFDHAGKIPAGWPKFTSQWNLMAPAVGDLDGDGKLEIASGTREGWLYLWETEGLVEAPHGSKVPSVQWASNRHDDRNTGNYGTPLPFKIAGPDEEEDGCGCTCAQAQTPPQALALMAAAFGALLWRRRRLGR